MKTYKEIILEKKSKSNDLPFGTIVYFVSGIGFSEKYQYAIKDKKGFYLIKSQGTDSNDIPFGTITNTKIDVGEKLNIIVKSIKLKDTIKAVLQLDILPEKSIIKVIQPKNISSDKGISMIFTKSKNKWVGDVTGKSIESKFFTTNINKDKLQWIK